MLLFQFSKFLFLMMIALSTLATSKLAIVLDDSFPPYSYHDQNQSPQGFYPLLVNEIFNKAQIEYTLSLFPWKRALSMLENDQAILAGIYKTDEREKDYYFSEPIFTEKLVIYVKDTHKRMFSSLEDLKGLKIGINLGWSVSNEFEELRKKNFFSVQDAKNTETNFRKLDHSRIDCFIVDELNGDISLKKLKLSSKIIKLEKPLSATPSFIAISKKRKNAQEIIAKINQQIISLKKSGTFALIINNFMQDQK